MKVEESRLFDEEVVKRILHISVKRALHISGKKPDKTSEEVYVDIESEFEEILNYVLDNTG
ncbi:MAG: hypothetical protein ACOCSE_00760 [Chitinivibrionales bacterium]